jgi:DNA repair protein RadC
MPEQVYQLVWPSLIHQDNELLIGLFLNRRKHLIQQEVLTRGTDWMTIVDPKQIYHKALLCRASGLVLVHNHPSGDPTPSEQDLRITKEIQRVGSILRIPLLDHLIVGGDSYVSFAALGLLS